MAAAWRPRGGRGGRVGVAGADRDRTLSSHLNFFFSSERLPNQIYDVWMGQKLTNKRSSGWYPYLRLGIQDIYRGLGRLPSLTHGRHINPIRARPSPSTGKSRVYGSLSLSLSSFFSLPQTSPCPSGPVQLRPATVPSSSRSDSTAGGIRQAVLPYFTALQVALCTFQCWAWQAFPQYLAALHRLHELRFAPLPDAPQ